MKRFGLNDFVTVKGNKGKLVGQVGAYMQPTGETLLVYYNNGDIKRFKHSELNEATEYDNWVMVQGDNCFWKTN